MSIYSDRPNLMIGFHGCDETVRNSLVLKPNAVRKSEETFDWLGHGFYVWENNYQRAYEWAKSKKRRGALKKPSVLGVVYVLGYCLDFTDTEYTTLIKKYYQLFKADIKLAGKPLPKNKDLPDDKFQDLILRELDCAVIEYMNQKIEEKKAEDIAQKEFSKLKSFDSVRGLFTEGGPAYEGAGIRAKTHAQVCIRNINCIKGFFIPRTEDVPQ